MYEDAEAKALSVRIATLSVEITAVVLGVLTPLAHLAQAARVSYTAFSLAGGILAIAAVVGAVTTRRREKVASDRTVAALLVTLALAAGALSLVAHRQDEDDWYYLPNVVRAVAYPDEPMGFEVRQLYSADAPFVSLTYSTAQAWEYLLSIPSTHLGIDYLDIYYIAAPFGVSMLIPIATFLLLVRLGERPPAAIAGTIVVLGVLLLTGETHNTPGNLSFTRAYQGKVLLLGAGIAAWAALAIGFLRERRRREWVILALLSTGLTGASATATILLPALALSIFAGHLLACRPGLRDALRTGATLASTLAYTVAFAIAIWGHSRANLDARSVANEGFPKTFDASLAMFRGSQLTYLELLVACIVACIVALGGRKRAMIVGWLGTMLVVFLNPLASRFWIDAVTPNLYWRLFYALPFPLIAGLLASGAWTRLSRFPAARLGCSALLVALLAYPHLEPRSSSIFRYGQGQYFGTEFGPPRHKIDPELEADAEAIASLAPPGPMLAPRRVCGVVPTVSADHPQLRIREDAERVWLAAAARHGEGELRIAASDFAGGDGGSFEAFTSVVKLHRDALSSVVLRRGVWRRPEVRGLLTSLGFSEIGSARSFVVLAKAPGATPPHGRAEAE